MLVGPLSAGERLSREPVFRVMRYIEIHRVAPKNFTACHRSLFLISFPDTRRIFSRSFAAIQCSSDLCPRRYADFLFWPPTRGHLRHFCWMCYAFLEQNSYTPISRLPFSFSSMRRGSTNISSYKLHYVFAPRWMKREKKEKKGKHEVYMLHEYRSKYRVG